MEGYGDTFGSQFEEANAGMKSRMVTRRIFLGLPAFNEFAAIGPLFEKIRAAHQDLVESELAQGIEVIFYDDGSTDGTASEVRSQTKELPVSLLLPAGNGGLGIALEKIINYFLEVGTESDVLVIMDSDDTHDPRQIKDVLLRMDRESEDIVIASRYRRGAVIAGVPLSRQVLSLGFAFLVKTMLPIKGVRDYSCGYRAYSYPALKEATSEYGFSLTESGFSAMPEILIRLRGKGWRFGEIPLHLAYDQRQTESKMRAWENSKRLLNCMVRWRVAAPADEPSRTSKSSPLEGIAVQRFNQS